jgi:hypothetical protein
MMKHQKEIGQILLPVKQKQFLFCFHDMHENKNSTKSSSSTTTTTASIMSLPSIIVAISLHGYKLRS